jgi:hypothetical protein
MKLPECDPTNEVGTKYRVLLACAPNPDIGGGWWGAPPDQSIWWACVDSIDAAREACEQYIDANDLGGGNWTGGLVHRWNGHQWIEHCRISYNGRAWLPNGEEFTQ